MLQFKEFSKSYTGRNILSIDNLSIDKGIYFLTGINGAGKSTLLKCVTGFINFQGDIFLNGISLRKNGISYRRLVNFGDAEPLFPDFLTGLEMIEIFAKAKNAPDGQAKELIDSMELSTFISDPIASYSSGMTKKLSLLLSFLGHPKLICLDEPMITLDRSSILKLSNWIIDYNTNKGTSFIISSHQNLEGLNFIGYSRMDIENGKIII
ncbi:MAG: ATP-binding cassette domain-containing protein [Pedobacter agri]